MRIIAGEARGRRLFAPDGLDTRPTQDRVRESLFNILGPLVPGARVLDLFAGSGAMGLEALSRGAAFAALNDFSRAAVKVIERNAALTGAGERALILQRDYRAAIEALRGERFSLIFLDPPYRLRAVYGEVAGALRARGMLAPDAALIMEHAADYEIALGADFEIFDVRRYGKTTCISLVRQREDAD